MGFATITLVLIDLVLAAVSQHQIVVQINPDHNSKELLIMGDVYNIIELQTGAFNCNAQVSSTTPLEVLQDSKPVMSLVQTEMGH